MDQLLGQHLGQILGQISTLYFSASFSASFSALPAHTAGSCPLLDPKTSRCLIYESRPLGCRTHFCAAAGGPYPRTHVLDLIRRLEEIDQDLGGDGSHPIEKSIAVALSDF